MRFKIASNAPGRLKDVKSAKIQNMNNIHDSLSNQRHQKHHKHHNHHNRHTFVVICVTVLIKISQSELDKLSHALNKYVGLHWILKFTFE